MKIDFLDMMKKIADIWGIHISIETGKGHESLDPKVYERLQKRYTQELLLTALDLGEQKNDLCFITDYFEVEYCTIRIPDSERAYGRYIVLGPYFTESVQTKELLAAMEKKTVPAAFLRELEEFYNAVPIVKNSIQWRNICHEMACILYQKPDIEMRFLTQTSAGKDFQTEEEEEEVSIRIIENRYAAENKILMAVVQGNVEEAMKCLNQCAQYRLTRRCKDPVREQRNELVKANTLWRKAAEYGGVHPAYIDQISRRFALKIEGTRDEQSFYRLRTEMLRKYCLLVKNYSLKEYSPIIQKIIAYINLNLTENLTLKYLAEEYNVNPSYLSSLFKKEKGVTITHYINQQRMRKAILLLNTTELSIQNIAFECGIYDVNYFSKQFKKITGQTPTAYAKMMRSCR